VGLVCGQIGDLSKAVSLPIFGGPGGNGFYYNCASTRSLGFLTWVRVRSGVWMDSIQGLCQAAAEGDSEKPPARDEPKVKLADELAAGIAVGVRRGEVTYELQSGGTLRIELEDGRVTKVRNSGAVPGGPAQQANNHCFGNRSRENGQALLGATIYLTD
jgi:hypothetical protein